MDRPVLTPVKTGRRRRMPHAALALPVLAVLLGAGATPGRAQTQQPPKVQWQRGIPIHTDLTSLTWASNGLIYLASYAHYYDGTTTNSYIDAYRASDLILVNSRKTFSFGGLYGGGITQIASTGYPGHIVLAAVGFETILDPAHPNIFYGSGYPTYSPHLRLFREDLTQIADIDLGTLPGSQFEDYYYRNYKLTVAFSADGNRLAVSNATVNSQGGPAQTLLFDTSLRESGNIVFIKAVSGVNPAFPTVGDSAFWTSDSGSHFIGYHSNGDAFENYQYSSGGLAYRNMGNGIALGFPVYRSYGPLFINGSILSSSGPGTGYAYNSNLTFSPYPANSTNSFFNSYDDMAAKLIKWNGLVTPNERIFLSGSVQQRASSKGWYGFVQVYDWDSHDSPIIWGNEMSAYQVQTDPSISASLRGFSPSFDSNSVALGYVGTTGGKYLQTKGIHNETLTQPELGGTIWASGISPTGATTGVVRQGDPGLQLDLYRSTDGARTKSIVLPADVQMYPNHIQFSKDGSLVATFTSFGVASLGDNVSPLLIFRVSDGALVKRLDLKNPAINKRFDRYALSPDFTLVAAGSVPAYSAGDVFLYRVSDGSLVSEFQQDTFPVAFTPDGSGFAAQRTADSKVEIRNIWTGTSRWTTALSSPAQALAFSPDGTTLASYYGGTTQVDFLNGANGAVKRSISVTVAGTSYPYDYFADPVNNIGFAPSGAFFAASEDNTVKVWDPATGTLLRSFTPSNVEASASGVSRFALAGNGQYFAYVTDQCLLAVAKAPYYGQSVRIGAGGLALASKSATDVTVGFSLKNFGTDPADVFTVTGATLGPANTPANAPLAPGHATLAAGDTKTFRFTFPISALNGTTGGIATFRLNGTYMGGTFSLTQRITVP